MAVWIIGDLHLSSDDRKPMAVFGPAWDNHQERVAAFWSAEVKCDDTVIIAGDISWALQAEDAISDLRFIDRLPGKVKYLLKGNHDFWWSTRTKLEALFDREGLTTLKLFQNECLSLPWERGLLYVVGSRGWKLPSDDSFTAEDGKIYEREAQRLMLSIKDLQKKAAANSVMKEALSDSTILTEDNKVEIIAVLHYPPVSKDGVGSIYSERLEATGVTRCYYGHVHGRAGRLSFRGKRNNITYFNIACDQTDCRLLKITN